MLKLGSIVAIVMMVVSVMSASAQQGGQGGQGQRQQGTPQEMAEANVKRLTEPLKLTEEQQKKLYDVYLKIMESRPTQQSGGERPDRETMMKAREKEAEEIKKVLTPEQQKLYDKMEEEMRKNQQNRQGQGNRQ